MIHYGYRTKRTESTNSKRYLCNPVHSSIIHKNQKVEATQMSIKRWMGKKNVVYTIHTGEYYLTLKRKEIQIHAATWMHLEDMMLSEISPSKKDRYCLIPLVWDSQSKSETESRMRLPGSGGKEEWGVCVNVYRVSVLQDKKVLETGYART